MTEIDEKGSGPFATQWQQTARKPANLRYFMIYFNYDFVTTENPLK